MSQGARCTTAYIPHVAVKKSPFHLLSYIRPVYLVWISIAPFGFRHRAKFWADEVASPSSCIIDLSF